jgi:hypothetical protein
MSTGSLMFDLQPVDSRHYVLALPLHWANDCPPDFAVPAALSEFEAGIFLPRGDHDWLGRPAYPPRILLLDGETLHVLPHPSAHEKPFTCALRRISFVESGHMLLKGWLRFAGPDFDRRIPFNTRALPPVSCFLRHFRLKLLGRANSPAAGAGEPLDLKFANVLAAELDNGEAVAAQFFQRPKQLQSRWLRIPARRWLAGDLLALTDRRVLWITDRERNSYARYGSISSYAPLCSLQALDLIPGDGGNLLQLRLAAGLRWDIPVRPENLPSACEFRRR